MKPTASALRHFVLGAAATALISTSSKSSLAVVVAQSTEKQTTQSAPKKQRYETTPDYDGQQKETMDHDGDHRENLQLRTHINHPRDKDGRLVSSTPPIPNPSTNKQLSNDTIERHERCHPDLGVLACTQPGEVCTKMIPSTVAGEDSVEQEEGQESWHCLQERIQAPLEEEDMSFDAMVVRRQQTERDLFNEFPPTGPVYDKCTYDLEYEYNYFSSIKEPSAWDKCACEGYNNDLPESTVYYTDVDYCFKINKYYCKKYHPAEDVNKQVTNYEICVCGSYKGQPVPDEPEDFCVEIGKRHCEEYYPNGDLVGFSDCLCKYFQYEDWCDWTPPPGFSPVPPPPPPTSTGPTKPPTRFPTRNPTLPPTRRPTPVPTLEPTKRPTLPPTKRPSPQPTEQPTPRPSANPTFSPTKRPTLKPTPGPTRAPASPGTADPTIFPTKKPTPQPTLQPTNKPTPQPTLQPTNKPTDQRTPPPTKRPTLFPTRRPFTAAPVPIQRPFPVTGPRTTPPTPAPTHEPTPGPTRKNKNKNKNKNKDKNKNKNKDKDNGNEDGNNDNGPETSDLFIDEPNENTNGNNNANPSTGNTSPVNTGNGLNVGNLQNIIMTLRRQPNISNRPGSSLRLQTYNVFDRNGDSKEGSSF